MPHFNPTGIQDLTSISNSLLYCIHIWPQLSFKKLDFLFRLSPLTQICLKLFVHSNRSFFNPSKKPNEYPHNNETAWNAVNVISECYKEDHRNAAVLWSCDFKLALGSLRWFILNHKHRIYTFSLPKKKSAKLQKIFPGIHLPGYETSPFYVKNYFDP